ncbi:MAG TPA: hypothetical protein VEF06_02085, partial [Bryobacteraceae bacterium]|nr:hypothetical protein [Bryobacteraceae bacterium]
LGRFVGTARTFVPATEAPIRDLRSNRGWHVVISALLDRADLTVRLRLRFFAANDKELRKVDLLSDLVSVEFGSFAGSDDEVLGVTSIEEHAYNDQTEIWLLPRTGSPKLLMSSPGSFRTIGKRAAGVIVLR